MAEKSDRAIVAPVIIYGNKKFKPGMEDSLAKAAPQWNIDQMVAKGWLSGDWSNAGLTPDEEAEVVQAEAKKAARKTTR